MTKKELAELDRLRIRCNRLDKENAKFREGFRAMDLIYRNQQMSTEMVAREMLKVALEILK